MMELKQMFKFCETFKGKELIDCYNNLSVDVIYQQTNFDFRKTHIKVNKLRYRYLLLEIYHQLIIDKKQYVNLNKLLTKKEKEHITYRIDIVNQLNKCNSDETKYYDAYYLVFSEIEEKKEYSNSQELIDDVTNSNVVVVKEYINISLDDISTILKRACGLYVKSIWE